MPTKTKRQSGGSDRGKGRSRLNSKKVALVHVAQRDLSLSDEDYRAILKREAGVTSATDLDELGFMAVMDRFGELGFRSTAAKRNYGERGGFASSAQVALMRKLWLEYLGTDDPEDRKLNAWLERFHKVSTLRFVTTEKAQKIIPALRAMSTQAKRAR